MQVKTLSRIAEVDPSAWNAIVPPGRLICRHEYFSAVEASQLNDCRYFYPVILDDNGQIVAHACLYYISTELDSFAQGVAKRIIQGIRKVWPSFLMLRSIECGSPIALGNTISFRAGCDQETILGLLVDEAERIARAEGVSVLLFRDFYGEELRRFDCLQRCDFGIVPNLPTTHLAIQWDSFDQYLGSMRRKYRRRIQKDVQAFSRPEVTVEIVSDFEPYSEALVTLWRNVYDRAKEYKREVLTAELFRNLSRHLRGEAAVLLVKVSGKPVAFALLLYNDNELIPLFCGLDYEYNEQYRLYMNLMNLEVRHAIEKRMKGLDLGFTTLYPKQEMGAEVLDLYMYMKHLNPVLNYFVPSAFRLMTPKTEKAVLRVFKKGEDV